MPDPLAPYAGPLTAADARHLLRRTGFGAPPARVAALVGQAPGAVARALVAEAVNAPALVPPVWYTQGQSTPSLPFTESESIHRRMLATPLREKLALFWHNHLPTQAGVYVDARFAWQYYALLHGHAVGNARTLVHAVGTTGAMLRFLDGNQNTAAAPNQNYARELLELFTVGIYGPDGAPNYTEADVREAARALTGWRTRGTADGRAETYFTPALFDAGVKTFLGQTGAWGYDDVVRIVYEQRGTQAAHFLARKLLAFFVTATPSAEAEAALGAVLTASGFEVRPALEVLFASAYFYAHAGALVKSPTDLMLGVAATLGATAFDGPRMRAACAGNTAVQDRSHVYFEPPSVAGWPGHNPPSATGSPSYRAWYAADDFPRLWDVLGTFALGDGGRLAYAPLSLAALAPDPADPFAVAVALAEHLFAVPIAAVSLPDLSRTPFAGDDAVPVPDWVTRAPAYVPTLAKLLLAGAPFYEWPTLAPATRAGLVRGYVRRLITEAPEFLLL